MKILEAKDIWDQVVDKYADSGFEDFEFARHLNTAMALVARGNSYNHLIKAGGPAGEPVFAFEQADLDDELLAPLVERTTVSSASNLITRTQIRAAFPDDTIRTGALGTVTETKKPDILKVMAVENSAGNGVTYVRWNDWARLAKNRHTKPSATQPHLGIFDEGYRVNPDGDYTFTVLRMPLHCWLSDDTPAQNIDPELPDSLMYDVIFKALALGGVQVREGEFLNALAAVRQTP